MTASLLGFICGLATGACIVGPLAWVMGIRTAYRELSRPVRSIRFGGDE